MAIKWYSCCNCGKAVRSGDGNPSSYGCSKADFHNWSELGEVGRKNYSCSNCGLVIQADGNPSSYGCPGGYHNWSEL